MILPLVVLALGAIFAGVLNLFETRGLGAFLGKSPSFAASYVVATGNHGNEQAFVRPLPFGQVARQEELEKYLKDVAEEDHYLHRQMMVISSLVAGLGIYLAYLLHLRDRAAGERVAQKLAPVARVLEAKFWIDEVYQRGIVEPLRNLGRFCFYVMDQYVVDGLVWLVSFIPQAGGFVLRFLTQRGYLQGYAVTMLLGIVVILVVVFLS